METTEKTLPKTITITITPKDFETSIFMSIKNCSLAKALKRAGYADFSVGGVSVSLLDGYNQEAEYSLSEYAGNEIVIRTGEKNQKRLRVELTKIS